MHMQQYLDHAHGIYKMLRHMGADREHAIQEAVYEVNGSSFNRFDEALVLFKENQELFKEASDVEFLHVSQLTTPASPDVIFVAAVSDCMTRIIENHLMRVSEDDGYIARCTVCVNAEDIEVVGWKIV